jgi:hypothetical protein
MYGRMLDWLDFYETYLLGRKLQPKDYIFPSISVNGRAEPHHPISSTIVQKTINDMSNAATLPGAGYYTTHCFRRGGAQHRFMFAPIGERGLLLGFDGGVGGWKANMSARISFIFLIHAD